jgi:hypothetical protein
MPAHVANEIGSDAPLNEAPLRIAALEAGEFMGWGREDTLYTAFPLFHVNAKFTSVMAALIAGTRLVTI